MTAQADGELSRGGAGRRPGSAGVLADRMAAALVHHEPGWRLPRLTALARRYNVSAAEANAALDQLATRHLVRRLPDGQVYRASPSVYHVPLEGVFGFASLVDPMGGQLACRSQSSSVRHLPDEIRCVLDLGPSDQAVAVRCLWTVGGEPGALSVTYLPERLAGTLLPHGPAGTLLPHGPGEELGDALAPPELAPLPGGPEAGLAAVAPDHENGLDAGFASSVALAPGEAAETVVIGTGSALFPWLPSDCGKLRPQALQVEMSLPPPAAARNLRIGASRLVSMVTMTVGDAVSGAPVGITMAMLRPELFRIVFEMAPPPVRAGSLGGLATAWTHAMADWEP